MTLFKINLTAFNNLPVQLLIALLQICCKCCAGETEGNGEIDGQKIRPYT